MEYLVYLWAVLLICGLILSQILQLFSMPANWVAIAFIAFWKWLYPESMTWNYVLFLIVLAGLAEGLEFFLQARYAGKYGASTRGNIGGIIGAIAGAIFGAPFFLGLGAVLGALGGEQAGSHACRQRCFCRQGSGLYDQDRHRCLHCGHVHPPGVALIPILARSPYSYSDEYPRQVTEKSSNARHAKRLAPHIPTLPYFFFIRTKPTAQIASVTTRKVINISFWTAPQMIYKEPIPASTGQRKREAGFKSVKVFITQR